MLGAKVGKGGAGNKKTQGPGKTETHKADTPVLVGGRRTAQLLPLGWIIEYSKTVSQLEYNCGAQRLRDTGTNEGARVRDPG